MGLLAQLFRETTLNDYILLKKDIETLKIDIDSMKSTINSLQISVKSVESRYMEFLQEKDAYIKTLRDRIEKRLILEETAKPKDILRSRLLRRV